MEEMQEKDEMKSLDDEWVEGDGLPPRAHYHRDRVKKKRSLFRLSFPLIRLWLVLFILLVILAVTSPYWLY